MGLISLDGRASVAPGNTSQKVDLSGFQNRLRPGMTAPDVFTDGGLHPPDRTSGGSGTTGSASSGRCR